MIPSKRFALFILIVLSITFSNISNAQINVDSLNAQKRYNQEISKRDSILLAAKQRQTQDSLNRIIQKQKLQEYRDSMRQALLEKRKQDSIMREELKAKMLAERMKRDSIRDAQREELKRIAEARRKTADSIRLARKAVTDSISKARAIAKKKRDAIRKYKSSKKYKDSIALSRQLRLDSIKQDRATRLAKIKEERIKRLDSIKAARTKELAEIKKERIRVRDSSIAARKSYNDSVKAEREKVIAALKLERQNRRDSLEKARGKTDIAKKKAKTETELLQEKARKIHARKQGSWTNEKLLKKGWNIKRRIWQNTVTRYNSYYNAKRKYDDALKRLKERHSEVLTEQISIYPYDLESGLTAIGGDMDTVIKKCAYDTQIHDPRSKWFDNLYHLMGKAFYFKNDYESAITAFQYVVNEYKDGDKDKKQKRGYKPLPALNDIKIDKDNKITLANIEKRKGLHVLAHHAIRNESLIWLARSYTKSKMFGEAQSLLTILSEDKQFPERLQDELYMAIAELSFEQSNDMAAIEPLEKALKQDGLNKSMRNRLNYLLAQLYAEDNNLEKSNEYFNNALKNKLPLEMEYFSKLHLAQNAIKGSNNKNQALDQLESLAAQDKFEKWRPQTYLTLGQILQEDQPERAITYYNKCLGEEKNEPLKAAAFLGLGEIYYKQANYRAAKVDYDSTIAFASQAKPSIKNMDQIKLRSEVLSSLVKYTDIIELEDSLQALGKMSIKDQIAVIKKELRRQQKERRKQLEAESAKLTAVALTPGKFDKKAWYFYNNTSVQQGMVEFKTKWGDRPLVDNWRRSGGGAFAGNTVIGNDDSTSNDDDGSMTRKAEVNKMLSEIYSNPEDFKNSDQRIADAYFQLGLIYSSRLQEYETSCNTFEAMNRRFDKHDQLAATYYSMILSNEKLNRTSKANEYRIKLQKEFPNTEFSELIEGSSIENQIKLEEVSALYDSAYQMLVRSEYSSALTNATASISKYPESNLIPKFELVQAKSLAGLKKYDSSIVVTENIIKSYPGTEEEKYAQLFLGLLKSDKNIQPGVKQAINNDPNSLTNKPSNAVFAYNKNRTHYMIILLNKIDGATIGLKAGLSDYNRLRHSDKKLRTNMNLLSRSSGIISVNEFKNADLANRYMKQVNNEPSLLSKVATVDFKIMIISDENFNELLKTRKVPEYIKFYKENY